jgi:hypothetical protein
MKLSKGESLLALGLLCVSACLVVAFAFRTANNSRTVKEKDPAAIVSETKPSQRDGAQPQVKPSQGVAVSDLRGKGIKVTELYPDGKEKSIEITYDNGRVYRERYRQNGEKSYAYDKLEYGVAYATEYGEGGVVKNESQFRKDGTLRRYYFRGLHLGEGTIQIYDLKGKMILRWHDFTASGLGEIIIRRNEDYELMWMCVPDPDGLHPDKYKVARKGQTLRMERTHIDVPSERDGSFWDTAWTDQYMDESGRKLYRQTWLIDSSFTRSGWYCSLFKLEEFDEAGKSVQRVVELEERKLTKVVSIHKDGSRTEMHFDSKEKPAYEVPFDSSGRRGNGTVFDPAKLPQTPTISPDRLTTVDLLPTDIDLP